MTQDNPKPKHQLTVTTHDRDVVGLTYVYPVLSRRAGGVSVGVNLNPNNACNWRCVYCQVPDLTFGKGPRIDLERLEGELTEMIRSILQERFLAEHVKGANVELKDVAFSGNGEPTSSPDFEAAVTVVGRVLERAGLLGRIPVVLITNGSLVHKPAVGRALKALSALGGEVWFKLDSATSAGLTRVNSSASSIEEHVERLRLTATACATWIQTCVFTRGGEPPDEAERDAYLDVLSRLVDEGTPLRGVLLYTLARPSFQPEAPELGALTPEWLEAFASEIRQRGVTVRVSA